MTYNVTSSEKQARIAFFEDEFFQQSPENTINIVCCNAMGLLMS